MVVLFSSYRRCLLRRLIRFMSNMKGKATTEKHDCSFEFYFKIRSGFISIYKIERLQSVIIILFNILVVYLQKQVQTMDKKELDSRISMKESFLLANDGQYLGKLSLNESNPDSISNGKGIYGSVYADTSFKNRYSVYGSAASSLSPYNASTSTPPVLYLKGQKAGFLSKNVNLPDRIDPDELDEWMTGEKLFD